MPTPCDFLKAGKWVAVRKRQPSSELASATAAVDRLLELRRESGLSDEAFCDRCRSVNLPVEKTRHASCTALMWALINALEGER